MLNQQTLINDNEKITLEYLSKTVLSGTRPYELEILRMFLQKDQISIEHFGREFTEKYGYDIDMKSFKNAIKVLQGHFISKEDEYQRYCHIDIISVDKESSLRRLSSYANNLLHNEFYKQINDMILSIILDTFYSHILLTAYAA